MEGLGGNVGPDLTRLWDTMSVEKILESIIEPSKEIKEGYQSFQVITKEGKTITGLKTVDKPTEVTIRDANGQDTRILRDDIEEIKVSKVSLMPDNVVAQLSYSQMLDLVAFLKNRQSQESLRGYVTDFKVVGPFPGDLKKPFGPEKQFEATASFPVENSKEPLKWQPRSGKTNGYLDFKEVFNKDNMAGYGLTYVYSPKSQKSILRLGANSHYQVWVNGNLVRSYEAAVRPNLPEQDEISVDLKEGWNPVVVKVVSKSKDHGFYLKVEGDQLKTSANGK
jgi:putative heme-binding domain-containing protein